MQANLIAAAEKRVDGKIASLKDLQTEMQTLLGQRDAADQAQINALVKTYASMKPADAARIFNNLDDTVELNVAALMKSDVLGAILAKMQPDMAQKLTVRLANRLKLPDPVAATAAAISTTCPAPGAAPAGTAQTASLDPASATPTPVTPTPAPATTTPVKQQSASASATTPPAKTQSAPAPAPVKTAAANAAPKLLGPTAPTAPVVPTTQAPVMKKGS
jgi:hypothetical protein